MTENPNSGDIGLVSPAQLAAVLYDQLDYLINHSHEGIEGGARCPDCARLAEVCDALIRPFMSRNAPLGLKATHHV